MQECGSRYTPGGVHTERTLCPPAGSSLMLPPGSVSQSQVQHCVHPENPTARPKLPEVFGLQEADVRNQKRVHLGAHRWQNALKQISTGRRARASTGGGAKHLEVRWSSATPSMLLGWRNLGSLNPSFRTSKTGMMDHKSTTRIVSHFDHFATNLSAKKYVFNIKYLTRFFSFFDLESQKLYGFKTL